MNRLLPLLLAGAIAVPALAQQPAPPPPPVDPVVVALRDAALKDDYAWDITEGLTTDALEVLQHVRPVGWADRRAVGEHAEGQIDRIREREIDRLELHAGQQVQRRAILTLDVDT